MKPIICRVNSRVWWTIVPGFLMSLAFIFGPTRSDPPEERATIILGLITGLLFLAMCVVLAIDALRAQVRADENGLRWREGLSGWKSARWDEISDFYRLGSQKGVPILETPRGKLWLSDRFSGIGAIVECVPPRAATAKARAWEVRGYRSGDNWEKTFSVWSKSQIWTAPLLTLAAIYVIGFLEFAILFGPRDMGARRNGFAPLDFQWYDTFGFVLASLMLISLGALMIVPTVFAWRERKFAHAHRDETLTLNARGLVFTSHAKTVEAIWSQVQRIEPRPREGKRGIAGYRVITENGAFTLWSLRSDSMFVHFRRRCESYAPDALQPLKSEELSFDTEINPPPATDGTQTFSFRTRGNRLIWLCVSSVLLFSPLFYLFSTYMNAKDEPFAPSWLLFGAGCVTAVIVSGALYLWFARASIVATADELQLRSPFRSARHIRWNAIEAAGADAWGNWVRADGRKIYWMRWLAPARRAELEALLKARGRIQT